MSKLCVEGVFLNTSTFVTHQVEQLGESWGTIRVNVTRRLNGLFSVSATGPQSNLVVKRVPKFIHWPRTIPQPKAILHIGFALPGISRVTADKLGWMQIRWEVYRFGWGYGLREAAVIFGVAVLLFHVFLVFVFAIYLAVFWLRGGCWTSRAWGATSEFLALALISPPRGDNVRTLRKIADGEVGATMLVVPVKVRENGERQPILAL
ncbi:hypothetical protein ACJZ2D_014120 [Fusarium nematophilum]